MYGLYSERERERERQTVYVVIMSLSVDFIEVSEWAVRNEKTKEMEVWQKSLSH